MSKKRTQPAPSVPLNGNAASGGWALRLVQQAVVLFLAVYGFLFCLLSSYSFDLPVLTLVWTAAAFALLSLAVFSVQRSGILSIVCLLVAGAWIFLNISAMVQGVLLLVEHVLSPLSLSLPDSIQSLILPLSDEYSTLLMTRALQAILFFVSFLSGYFISISSVPGLALATLPLLLPAPFYLLSPSVFAFFALFAAHLMVFAFNNGKRASSSLRSMAYIPQNRRKLELNAQRATQQTLSLLVLPLIIFAALLSSLVLPQEGYERPQAIEDLQQKIFDLNLGKDGFWKSNDGLTRGDLRNLSSIRFTGDTAIQVRVSDELSLYLRGFAGAVYSDDGWSNVSSADFSDLASSVNAIAPQNMLSAAATVSSSAFSTFDLAVKNVSATPLSIWTPPGLVTTAAEISNAGYVQDTALAFASSSHSSEYSITAIPVGMALYSVSGITADADEDVVRRAYQNAAGAAYGLSSASGDDAALVQQAAETYIDYVVDVYTALPDDTLAAAQQLLATYGLTRQVENGSLNLAATCQEIHTLLSEQCNYDYSPPEIPEGVDFSTYFLQVSQSGYCVHFATTATVLLRALGIPARYAEGYIVIRSDYEKTPDSEGYIDIEDTHAHAWVEVFDPAQLEWIPVEMTKSASDSANPTPDSSGDAEGEPTFSLDESTPTVSPEPTPTATVNETPEASADDESTPDPNAETDTEQEITPTPAPTEDGTEESTEESADATPAPDEEGSAYTTPSESPPLWPVLVIVLALGLPLAAILWRKSAHDKRMRSFTQKDMNAAVLSVCRYALDMLRFAGAPAMQSLETPELYAYTVSKKMPSIDRERLEALLISAQRAKFSNKTSSKKERDEGIQFIRVLSNAVFARLSRFKRLIFLWRFPKI